VAISQEKLDAAQAAMTERIKKYDERILNVLKNHLGFEQILNDLLAAASRRWKRRTCAGKIDVAKKLFLKEMNEPQWVVAVAGNELRNAIAHGHKEGQIAAKMVALRKAYLASLTPEPAKASENLTDSQMVTMAFTGVGSHLAAERVSEEKKK
jgi:hypothetical protein